MPPVPSCGSEGREQPGQGVVQAAGTLGLSRAPARDSKWHRVPAPSTVPCGLTMPAHVRVCTRVGVQVLAPPTHVCPTLRIAAFLRHSKLPEGWGSCVQKLL